MKIAGTSLPAPFRPGPLIERTATAAPRPILRHIGVNSVPGREHFYALKGGNVVFHAGRCAR